MNTTHRKLLAIALLATDLLVGTLPSQALADDEVLVTAGDTGTCVCDGQRQDGNYTSISRFSTYAQCQRIAARFVQNHPGSGCAFIPDGEYGGLPLK